MWLSLKNVYTAVSRATPEEIEWLRSEDSGLTYRNRSAVFSGGPSHTRFFDLVDSRFPTGFVPTVERNAARAGIRVEKIDARFPSVKAEGVADSFRLSGNGHWLRDYQVDAAELALQATRGIIQIPTGGGKTEVAAAIAKHVPVKWLFIVHRQTLMTQAAERYKLRTGDEAGLLGAGHRSLGARLTCATFQTLAKAQATNPNKINAWLSQFEGIMIDECHVLPAATFLRVVMAMERAFYRIGISGTPLDREDQRSVNAVAAMGPVIYKLPAKFLIESGELARPIITMARVKQVFREVDKDGFVKRWDWQKVYREGIVRSPKRNRILLTAVERAEKPCLVFVKEVEHGKALARAMKKRGWAADFVWGSDSEKARKDAVTKLVRRDLDTLVCSVIFQEGVDIPSLRSVVIGSGGKSVIAALQRIGRGMRIDKDANGKVRPGGDTFEVWDFDDDGNPWLARHAKARRGAYRREGYQIKSVDLPPSMLPGESLTGIISSQNGFRPGSAVLGKGQQDLGLLAVGGRSAAKRLRADQAGEEEPLRPSAELSDPLRRDP